ncbi:MAG: RNA polymerase factor sigma-54 [Acidobacteria bacterium]|nr:RNA polymerase factor sigma-54 [Acidobacteriota bacterium]
MALEQKLNLKMSQKLIMTPSLQQAIKLLQLSKLELQEVLNEELLENPLLEESKQEEEPEAKAEEERKEEDDKAREAETGEKDSFDEIDYEAYFQDYVDYGYNPRMSEEYEEYRIENTLTKPPDLWDHLSWQLSMSDAPPRIKEICVFLIGNVDEDGYLRASREELHEADSSWTDEEIDQAVAKLQSFDPAGVGTRDLRECLMNQLERLEIEDEVVNQVVDQHWQLFMNRQYAQIAKAIGVELKELEVVVETIRQLDPKPGRRYSSERAVYVEPDVHVYKVGDEYVIVLNEDGMPKLRINSRYRRMLSQMNSKEEGETVNYIKEKIRSAVWLIKSLDQRQRTIYKVAQSIVKHQREFLELGIEHLRPLVLRDVADDIQMHESTVSRVVSNKYIHTPRGVFLMKYFFHSGIDSDYGEDISSLAVKKKIRTYIDQEDPKKPLSDSKIMKILNDEGINIARRTVAKYRDELNIPSSTDRKAIF